jgi:hypothetical protein
MRDEKEWQRALAEFRAMQGNIPGYISEGFVREYHGILDRMTTASGEDFESFRIPQSELKPRVTGFRPAGRRSPGATYYSKDNFCDSNLFQRKIDSLASYLPAIESTSHQMQVSDDSKDYWSMGTEQLTRVADKYNIGGYADQLGNVDRDIIINALLRRDEAMQPKNTPMHHHLANYGTIVGSNIQQGSPGASVTVTNSIEDQHRLVQQIREAIPQLTLSSDQKRTIETDLKTIELQLNSGNARKVILNDCWSSVRNILEGVAGSLIATTLLYELAKFMQ